MLNGSGPNLWLGPEPVMCVRRCPTLPHPPGCSTIGAVGLSFRVRNGTGRFPHAMTAVTFSPGPRPCVAGLGSVVVTTIVVLLFSCVFVPEATFGLLFGNHIVDASSLVFFLLPVDRVPLLKRVHTGGVWCKLSAY